jgi:hypothetical protein
MSPRYSIDEIKHRLTQRALDLAQRLTPNGRLDGKQWWFRNPKRSDGGNLHTASVNVHSGIWKDFSNAGGGEGGDMLKFVAEFACGGDTKRAWRWSLDYLGLTSRAPDPAETKMLAERAQTAAAEEAAKLERLRAFCMKLWIEAKPLDGHDPASQYLAGRGIDVHAIPGDIPRALRFHPRLEARTERGTYFPAMIGYVALEGLKHGLATLHCTYLAEQGGRWRKADRGERASKEVICAYAGGSIRLTRGGSHRPLAKAPVGERILLSEGIENGLTGAIARPETRTLATVALANLGNVALPTAIRHATILADNDGDNDQARKLLDRAVQQLIDRGIEVAIARVEGFKDFNAALTGAA